MAPSTPSTQKDNAPKVASAKVVQYIGPADRREIDKASWDSLDITGEGVKKVVFDKSNKWRVPADEFNDAQMAYFDESDDGFVVKDVEVPKS